MIEDKDSKYGGLRFEFVKRMMKEGLNITASSKMMCKEFGYEYDDSVRGCVSRLLKKDRGEHLEKDELEEKETDVILNAAKAKSLDKKRDTFIITWAQNSTPIHKGFFKNIQAYGEHLNAGIHVIAGRYKNPTSIWSSMQEKDEGWVKEVIPYLDANRHKIHKNLEVLSDVKIPPTASTPLSGLNGLTGLESCIVGHPRQHLKPLAVLKGYPHKLLLSTGSCTIPNYTDSKSGKKGEFHHTFGFIIVELDGDNFHVRQVSADTEGNFYDLYHRVKDGVVFGNTEGCEAAILGDIHIQHNNKIATDLSFKMLDFMKPKHTMIHDIIDCESISHWDSIDPFRMMQKEEEGTDNLKRELEGMVDWIGERLKYNLVIVRSNHDDFLDRWLKFTDWRKCNNKKLYLMGANLLANDPIAQTKGVIPCLIDNAYGDYVTTLGIDDSFPVLGWELGMHGHLGASGSRGSHGQFKNLNVKNVTGHVHHPYREDGHASVGTLTDLSVHYTKGLSNWMHSNGLIYPDGKFQHIHIVNGKYCRDMIDMSGV
tara:strand:- start:1282 stop:2898 length:1617 start_codon:yes stop_codon:yes gene_type:complete